jgi:hypothetical protein
VSFDTDARLKLEHPYVARAAPRTFSGAKDTMMSVLPILADVDWFYVAVYALIFFSALIVTLALIWGYLALHL